MIALRSAGPARPAALPMELRPEQSVELQAHAAELPRAWPVERQPELAAPQSLAGPRQRDELPQLGRPAEALWEQRQERASAQAEAQPWLQEAQRPARPPQQARVPVAQRGEQRA